MQEALFLNKKISEMVKRGENYFQEQNKVDSGSYFTDGMYLWQLYIKQVYRGGSGGGKAGSGNPGCRTRGK